MFGTLFSKKSPPSLPTEVVLVKLNARLQPMDRGEIFEDPLDSALKEHGFGEVSGGGTMLSETGEIEGCDLELQVPQAGAELVEFLVETLQSLGAPRGSQFVVEDRQLERAFGQAEGLAVYLNGTDLSDETYQNCDSNFVVSEFDRLLGDQGRVFSYWEGPTETALYVYGASFAQMQGRLSDFLRTYPLCEKCRVVQIA